MTTGRQLIGTVFQGVIVNLKILVAAIIIGVIVGKLYVIDPRAIYGGKNIAFTATSIFANNVARVTFALVVALTLYYLAKRTGLREPLGHIVIWFFPATLIAVNGILIGMVIVSPKAWALVLNNCDYNMKWGPVAVATALIPHGVFELTGVAVLLSPATPIMQKNLDRYGLKLIAVATAIGIPLLVVAALIETHITPIVENHVRMFLCRY